MKFLLLPLSAIYICKGSREPAVFSLERILERLGATSFSFIRLSGTKHPDGWREAGQDKEALRVCRCTLLCHGGWVCL